MKQINFPKKSIFVSIFLLVVSPVFAHSVFTSFALQTLGLDSVLFVLFALILFGIAFWHEKAFYFSIFGALTIYLFKEWSDSGFNILEHVFGENSFLEQVTSKEMRQGEWSILVNLFGLLLGFAVLAKLFEDSEIPHLIPNFLPSGWKGPFLLLFIVFVMSSFLDNIAAALVGGTIALVVFQKKLHIGYLAAIVAASNAGGAGSVVGDTTTTMMWIDGVNAVNVLHAFIASGFAFVFFAWFASRQQQKFYPIIQQDKKITANIKWLNVVAVISILIGAIISNVLFDMPAFGVWVAIVIGVLYTKVPFGEVKLNMKGTFFLLGLIFSASMMPVDELPAASWSTAFVLGFVSAFFDNIPLTKICLEQGHYDWGMLAYSVGFGGSMVWFGSSAGVALTNKFHKARNLSLWVKNGWHVIVAYIIGFFMLYFIAGWEPADNSKHRVENCPVIDCPFRNKPEK